MTDALLRFDAAYHARGLTPLAGVDEAGRGCLAGPVVAAAVLLPPDALLAGVTDSKQLSPDGRARAFEAIHEQAWAVGVGTCSPAEIDRLNILHASLEAMRRAVEALGVLPAHVLVDGNRVFPRCPAPAEAIVKGDARSLCVAAASIVAKVTRDRLMERLHDMHPQYGWDRNKGYPTAAHYAGLAEHGSTPHHRRSFRLGPLPAPSTLF